MFSLIREPTFNECFELLQSEINSLFISIGIRRTPRKHGSNFRSSLLDIKSLNTVRIMINNMDVSVSIERYICQQVKRISSCYFTTLPHHHIDIILCASVKIPQIPCNGSQNTICFFLQRQRYLLLHL